MFRCAHRIWSMISRVFTAYPLPPRRGVQGEIGHGGHGSVHKARLSDSPVPVAVKVLAPQDAQTQREVEMVRDRAGCVLPRFGCGGKRPRVTKIVLLRRRSSSRATPTIT